MSFLFERLSCFVVVLLVSHFMVTCLGYEPVHFCDEDVEKCVAHHLDNPAFISMVNSRCNLESKDSRRRISFTHLPKTGGSTVREELQILGGRTRVQPSHHHVHFLQSRSSHPFNIFVTMLRDPVARAISYYRYVQQFNITGDVEKYKNKLWTGTFNVPATDWASNATIQAILATDPLGYFLVGVKNIRDHVSDIDFPKMRRLPQIPFDDTIPGTSRELQQYALSLPAQYRCTDHLQVAFILLKRYEVVGVLEKSADFYSTLYRRASLTRKDNSTIRHKNPTRFKLTTAAKQEMKVLLYRPLFCNRVLWKMAGIISDADAKCANIKTRTL